MRKDREKRKTKNEREREDILNELEEITEMIKQNDILFNMADDEKMVEALIYEQKSLQAKYIYLVNKAREKGFKIEYIDRLTQ